MSSLYAIHDENNWDYPGYEVRVEQIGHDPTHTGGTDYRDARHTVIARLQNEWAPGGCIPLPEFYESFAIRVQHFVQNSQGCSRWIIGNEMNHSQEWPYGRQIHPEDYGTCFKLCYDRIKSLPGHENDQVIIGAVAPYNNWAQYPGNPNGDWVVYFKHILEACGEFDAIALHTYGIEQVPSDPSSEAMMGSGYKHLHAGFRAYQDFLYAVSNSLWHLPVYITETNPNARGGNPWQDQDTGWVTAAYDEIDQWNQATLHGPLIHCLALYSHDMRGDGMGFEHKPGVRSDFERAVSRGYTVPEIEPPDPEPPEPELPEPPQSGECLWDEARILQIETTLVDILERLEVGGRGLLGE
jgi:hypothetical protein